jgi:ABC-type Fe3+-hydroxamate transport system substrate-binding protein
LPLFGCTPNNRGDYIFVDANTPQEIALRETAANEFRQFYDEIKKVKNGNVNVVEYFLNVKFRKLIKPIFLLFLLFLASK